MSTEIYPEIKVDDLRGFRCFEATINKDYEAINSPRWFAAEVASFRKGDRVIVVFVKGEWVDVIGIMRNGKYKMAKASYMSDDTQYLLRRRRLTDVVSRLKMVKFEGIDHLINTGCVDA